MKIVQLSDIHLSKANIENLKNFYLDALITDLKHFSNGAVIDLIIFNGDLIDKGGESFGGENPYILFENVVINPIMKELNLPKSSFLFVPGNHDVQRAFIDEDNEYRIAATLDSKGANELLPKMETSYSRENHRIQAFKDFEKEFHKDNQLYEFSNNQSLIVFEKDDLRVGIALINDSWRCSSSLLNKQHFIGYNQLLTAKNIFWKMVVILI